MIDASVASMLHTLDTIGNDRAHAFDPGYEPVNRDLASRSTRTIADVDNPLAVIVPPGAYLAVQGPAGAAYSRDGQLRFEDGELRTSAGDTVLGWAPGANLNLPPQPLRADPVDAALGRCKDVSVAADGTLSYQRTAVDARHGRVGHEKVVIGRVALARFPAGTKLERAGNDAALPADGLAPAALAAPNTLGFGELRTHRREVASVDFVKATTRWTEAVQAYYALVEARSHDGSKTVMDLVK